MSRSFLRPLGLSTDCGISRLLGSSPIHVSDPWRTSAILLICCPATQWWRAGHYFCYAKVKSNFLPNKGKTCAGEETAVLLATKMLGERRSPYGLDWICFEVLMVLQFFAGFLFRSHAVRLQISLLCRPAMCYGT